MPKTENFKTQGNTGTRVHMSSVAQHELEVACLEGLSADEIRSRLIRCGLVWSERTIKRRMSEWRAKQHENQRLQQLGIGIGSVHADIGAITATMQTAAPEWRQQHVAKLRSSFEQFVDSPSSANFTAVVVQSYSLLISTNLEALFADKDA